MNTGDVREMFKSYADEADTTFLTDLQITLYLKEGYNDFRRAVCDIDPYIYSIEYVFTMPSTGILDLTQTAPNRILGAPGLPATAGHKLERLLRLARINDVTNNDVVYYLDSAPSEKTMNAFCYTFIRNSIITYAKGSDAFRMEYVPFHNVDFSAASDFIDNLDGFHDMIPLYAYSRYAIRDGADNPQIQEEIFRKLADLKEFLETGRSREGSQFVTPFEPGY
tara:strand:+ start:3788 stop:4456 length:669 start_codon:yes stop_codon:yes gene_type:complete